MTAAPVVVSVIVPYYGERAALERCLQSLAHQTVGRESFEVIVVNNRPAQALTLEVSDLLANLAVVDEAQLGSYAARNRGAMLARGRWLAFTDADCVPDDHWLEAGLLHAARHEPLGGHIELVMTNPQSLVEKYDVAFGLNQQSYVEKSGFAATANLIVAKTTFDKVGPFCARLRSAGDWEWCLRAARAGHPVGYCAGAIVRHATRTTWRQVVRKALRVQGGMLTLRMQLHLALAPGACRSLLDAFYPRRYVAKIIAIRNAGDPSWWKLYLAACGVNALAVAETCRLRLGGTPLR
ncbi:glycosyltransferase family 2 protein [Caenimonas koreensis]|uniref:glycosyltransferase family 2 protein n=1 Tax=Caenimonas koreensis TaxID=367474 RepID=UPI00188F1F0B|nr:glycosyltransferase family A protein [Caenimonas koreensis]